MKTSPLSFATKPPNSSVLSLQRRLLFGGGWASVGRGSVMIAGLAVNALLAHLLAPREMGTYFLIFSMVSVAALLAQLGLKQAVVRLVAESMSAGKPGRARAAVSMVFQYGLMGSVVVAVILISGVGRWLVRWVFDSSVTPAVVVIAAIWVVVVAMQSLFAETFRGFNDIRLAALFDRTVSYVICALVLGSLWLMKGHSSLSLILVLSVAAWATSTLIAGILLRQKLANIKSYEPLHWQEVLSIAWPLLITELTLFALTQADLWVLAAFRPQEEVAIYGAAARLVVLISMPLSVVNAVVAPLIAEMYALGKKKELEHMLRGTATLAGIPALVIFFGFFFLGPVILVIVYGNYYQAGVSVLLLLSAGQLANVWMGSCGLVLIMTGHQRTMMGITIASGVIALVGAMWLVDDYGGHGVAAAAAGGMIFQNTAMLLLAKRKAGGLDTCSAPSMENYAKRATALRLSSFKAAQHPNKIYSGTYVKVARHLAFEYPPEGPDVLVKVVPIKTCGFGFVAEARIAIQELNGLGTFHLTIPQPVSCKARKPRDGNQSKWIKEGIDPTVRRDNVSIHFLFHGFLKRTWVAGNSGTSSVLSKTGASSASLSYPLSIGTKRLVHAF